MDFTTIEIDDLALSLKLDELIKIDFFEQHEQPSYAVVATVVLKGTLFKPIYEEKEVYHHFGTPQID